MPRGSDYPICDDCPGYGWGPMLTTKAWNMIVPKAQSYETFLCQQCMEKRFGRRLRATDIRDCPMNYEHPLYKNHGKR